MIPSSTLGKTRLHIFASLKLSRITSCCLVAVETVDVNLSAVTLVRLILKQVQSFYFCNSLVICAEGQGLPSLKTKRLTSWWCVISSTDSRLHSHRRRVRGGGWDQRPCECHHHHPIHSQWLWTSPAFRVLWKCGESSKKEHFHSHCCWRSFILQPVTDNSGAPHSHVN